MPKVAIVVWDLQPTLFPPTYPGIPTSTVGLVGWYANLSLPCPPQPTCPPPKKTQRNPHRIEGIEEEAKSEENAKDKNQGISQDHGNEKDWTRIPSHQKQEYDGEHCRLATAVDWIVVLIGCIWLVYLKNMLKSNWKSSPNRGENKKYLKPLPRYSYCTYWSLFFLNPKKHHMDS